MMPPRLQKGGEMVAGEELVEAVGTADMFELLGRVFSFPNQEIANALSDESLYSDLKSCLSDAGVDVSEPLQKSCDAALRSLGGCDASELLEQLRIGYSLTYLSPGKPPVYPYESAFRHVVDGKPGSPALFRSPVTLDVEREMRQAGVMPVDSRIIPCDAFWNECAYLAYVFGKRADAMQRSDKESLDKWTENASSFVDDHVSKWMGSFLEATAKCEEAGAYGGIAALAKPFIDVVCKRYRRSVPE